ncbi:hypothetical protein ASG29_10810 [Sphingomonas sp. Leaf412]|uniref:hypothetical protein n=1 Tax=Sphingomonas sp. Leaf412 TaxID=1736370 RepID=UPI0006F5AC28|nr:hypothetical protein [Sphingomonas sp. Leaf412]KQT32298.1 hypothetical protein ASG29_10810 [Sphingomonas sp. Leaf412]
MLAAAMAVAFASPVAAGVSPTVLAERAAFVDCAHVLDGTLRLTDVEALARAGYDAPVRNDNGVRAASREREGAVRIGMNAGKRGCIVEYESAAASWNMRADRPRSSTKHSFAGSSRAVSGSPTARADHRKRTLSSIR